jgi:hypothetical protein
VHLHGGSYIGGVWFKNLSEWNAPFQILRKECLRSTFENKNDATPIFCLVKGM